MEFMIKDPCEGLFMVKLYPGDNDLKYLQDILQYIPNDLTNLKNYISELIEKHEEYYNNREGFNFEPPMFDPMIWNK